MRVNGLFSSGAVLQQEMTVPVWGTASESEKIIVEFQDQSVHTTARGGKWMLRLKSLRPGGPFTMTIRGRNSIVLDDILVGEVWMCSGQSNMQMPVSQSDGAEKAIAESRDPEIRLCTMPRTDAPVENVNTAWLKCGPETVGGFSAVGYYFGRELRKALRVPIGLIDTSVGGAAGESFVSRDVLAAHPETQDLLIHPIPNVTGPAWFYNGMIKPLQPYAIRGVIWYQGETNCIRAEQYKTVLRALIESWRKDWGQGDFPFLITQLSGFYKKRSEPVESTMAELREVQLLTSQRVPHTALAVTADYGDEDDIHAKRKEPVGYRLALAARAIAYGEKIEYSGPIYKSMKVKNSRVLLNFSHTGSRLIASGTELEGFTIAGADGKFFNAKAEIVGNGVKVWSPQVPVPAAVRYGWTNYPVINLYNKEDLPASPFRTDSFPGVRTILRQHIVRFKENAGRFPSSLQELVDAGHIFELPPPPADAEFVYDSSDGSLNVK